MLSDNDIPPDIAIPVQASNVEDVCRAFTALLPSWNTGDEVDSMVRTGIVPVFVDVGFDEGGALTWLRRGERVNGSVALNRTLPGDPCTNVTDLCQSLNWNNLLFRQPTTGINIPGLTDGRSAVTMMRSDVRIYLNSTSSNVVIEMWLNRLEPGFTASTNAGTCTSTGSTARLNSWECPFAGVTWVKLLKSAPELAQVTEIRVFPVLDSARVPGYFTI